MSKQIVQDVAQNTYHPYLHKMALSCGCEYPCGYSVKIGDIAECARCPISVSTAEGRGVNRWKVAQ